MENELKEYNKITSQFYSNKHLVRFINIVTFSTILYSLYNFITEEVDFSMFRSQSTYTAVDTAASLYSRDNQSDVLATPNYKDPSFYDVSNLRQIQSQNYPSEKIGDIQSGILENIPIPQNFVSDYAGYFTKSQSDSLESLLNYYYETNGLSIVVATFYPFMYSDLRDFSSKLFNKWGIGDSLTNLGIFISLDTINRSVQILNGLGIEKYQSDVETGKVLNEYITPWFKQSLYFKGIYDGVIVMANNINNKRGIKNEASVSTIKNFFHINDPDGYTNLRNKVNGDIIRKVYPSEKFAVIDSAKNYYIVRFLNNEVGFIFKSRVVRD